MTTPSASSAGLSDQARIPGRGGRERCRCPDAHRQQGRAGRRDHRREHAADERPRARQAPAGGPPHGPHADHRAVRRQAGAGHPGRLLARGRRLHRKADRSGGPRRQDRDDPATNTRRGRGHRGTPQARRGHRVRARQGRCWRDHARGQRRGGTRRRWQVRRAHRPESAVRHRRDVLRPATARDDRRVRARRCQLA